MKKVLALAIMISSAGMLMAQSKDQLGKREANLQKLKERLQLSEAQVSSMKAVQEEFKPQAESIRKDENMTRPDKMRAHADILEKREAKINALLTEEQQAELIKIKKEQNLKKGDKMMKRGKKLQKRGSELKQRG